MVTPLPGAAARNSTTKIRTTMPPRYPRPQAVLEIRPTFSGVVRRGIMESLKTMENSAAMEARIMKVTGQRRAEPGAANHNIERLAIFSVAKNAIHGFLEPD